MIFFTVWKCWCVISQVHGNLHCLISYFLCIVLVTWLEEYNCVTSVPASLSRKTFIEQLLCVGDFVRKTCQKNLARHELRVWWASGKAFFSVLIMMAICCLWHCRIGHYKLLLSWIIFNHCHLYLFHNRISPFCLILDGKICGDTGSHSSDSLCR